MNFKNQQKFSNFNNLKRYYEFFFSIFIEHHAHLKFNDYYVKISICETIRYSL